MRALRAAAGALIAVCCAACASAQGGPEAPGGDARTLLQTGHRGEVLAVEYDESRGLLFSAGEDGTLRVWDLAARALVARIGVGQLPLASIAVKATATQVAVLESDGVRNFAVSAWDWRRGQASLPRDARGRTPVPPLFGRRQLAHARGVGLAGTAPALGR